MRKIILILVALLTVACSPRIIEHIVYQRDTAYVTRVDSIWQLQRDSVFVREKGDTVYQYVEHIRYRDRIKVDTLIRVKIDSVTVETIKEVEVEKPLTWWQKARQRAFWPLLLACLGLIVYVFRKPIWELIKKLIAK